MSGHAGLNGKEALRGIVSKNPQQCWGLNSKESRQAGKLFFLDSRLRGNDRGHREAVFAGSAFA